MRWGVLVLAMLMAPVATAAELRDLRLWDSPESTRVVFDLDGDITHKIFTLANPDRVVVDIAGISGKSMKKINAVAGLGVVERLRSGPRGNGLRVVLDVKGSVFASSFELMPNEEYGHRLVVDISNPESARAEPDPLHDSIGALAAAAPLNQPATVASNSAAPVVSAIAQAPSVAAPVTSAPAPAIASSAPSSSLRDKPIVITIDAGHGGEDPGAKGRSGLREKDVALSVARKLAKLINSMPNMKAVLTRDGDYYLGLRERVNVARKHQADLFVSVHCNAFTKSHLRGTAVYVLSDRGATNEHARWLAHKENSADLVGGVALHGKDNELAAVLIDLSQGATMEASFDVGSRILSSMGKINRLQKDDIQQAGFAVLKAPDIPSVLVETAFITNAAEEKLLASKEFQDNLAKQIFEGINGYFQSYRPKQQLVETEPGLQYVSSNISTERTRSGATITQGVSQ
jgi:N-acetylmuramoyl-L-alanine amidase